MKIYRFEEIAAWQEARKLVKMVYDVVRKSKEFQKDFRLVNQIQDASVSVMSNISEGFSRKGNKEFVQFLFISKSSASEVQSHLYVALDQGYVMEKDFNDIYSQADLVSKMISGFICQVFSHLDKIA